MTPGWGSATRPVFLGDTAGGISSQWCLHCSHYPTPHPAPERELHVFFTVLCLVPEQWWVHWSCSRNTCWMNGLTEYHVSPFPQSVPKWEDGFGKKEGRSKNELDRLPGVLVLNSYTSVSVLIFPRSGQPLSLAYSFQELYLMWAVKLTVESPISLRMSLRSIPLLEMSGSNFVLQLYLLLLC